MTEEHKHEEIFCSKVEGHEKTLYGEEGLTGIVGMLPNFVTRRTLTKWAVIAIMAFGGVFAYMWADWRSFPITYAKDTDLKILETSVSGLCSKIDDVKEAIDSHAKTSIEEVREIRKEVIEILKSQARQEKIHEGKRPTTDP